MHLPHVLAADLLKVSFVNLKMCPKQLRWVRHLNRKLKAAVRTGRDELYFYFFIFTPWEENATVEHMLANRKWMKPSAHPGLDETHPTPGSWEWVAGCWCWAPPSGESVWPGTPRSVWGNPRGWPPWWRPAAALAKEEGQGEMVVEKERWIDGMDCARRQDGEE